MHRSVAKTIVFGWIWSTQSWQIWETGSRKSLWLPEALLDKRLQVRQLFQFCPRGNFLRIRFHNVFQFDSKSGAHILVSKSVKQDKIQRSGDSGSSGPKKDMSLIAQPTHGQFWFGHVTVKDVTEKWHVRINTRLFSIFLVTFRIDYVLSRQLCFVVNWCQLMWNLKVRTSWNLFNNWTAGANAKTASGMKAEAL